MKRNDPASHFDDEFRAAVRAACKDILANPMTSDIVHISKVMKDDRVRQASTHTEDGLRSRIGRLLTEEAYAEKIARGKYRVQLMEEAAPPQ